MIQFPNGLPLILALSSNPADLAQVSASGYAPPQAGLTAAIDANPCGCWS